jgi:hypothetical protein
MTTLASIVLPQGAEMGVYLDPSWTQELRPLCSYAATLAESEGRDDLVKIRVRSGFTKTD